MKYVIPSTAPDDDHRENTNLGGFSLGGPSSSPGSSPFPPSPLTPSRLCFEILRRRLCAVRENDGARLCVSSHVEPAKEHFTRTLALFFFFFIYYFFFIYMCMNFRLFSLSVFIYLYTFVFRTYYKFRSFSPPLVPPSLSRRQQSHSGSEARDRQIPSFWFEDVILSARNFSNFRASAREWIFVVQIRESFPR